MIEAVLSGARAWHVECGDALDVLRALPADSIHACATDPPYGIGFMGREWDSFKPERVSSEQIRRSRKNVPPPPSSWGRGIASPSASRAEIEYDLSPTGKQRFQEWCTEWAAELLRVLKPGAHAIIFGGARTYHRMASGIEDAGFELRDQLMWIFGQGYPKNHNLGDGIGTALKPAHEPIVLARKPISEKTVAANLARWSTGGLAIDECRIAADEHLARSSAKAGTRAGEASADRLYADRGDTSFKMKPGIRSPGDPRGRWPANVMLDEDAARAIDEQSGELVSGANPTRRRSDKFRDVYGDFPGQEECDPARAADRGGASRFFYCAKVARREREIGMNGFADRAVLWSSSEKNPGSFQSANTHRAARNHHPTVKPVAVMQWLIRLIAPGGGLVVDPFCGSGTTGMAALREGRRFLGVEREAEYVEIARARITGDAPLLNTEVGS